MTINAFFAVLADDPRRSFRWLQRGVLAALVVLDLVLAAVTGTPAGSLEVKLRSTVDSEMQVYFNTGNGLVEKESVARRLTAGPETQTLSFPLPPRRVLAVRIDPLNVPGTVNIHSLRVLRDRDRTETRAFDVESLKPTAEIAGVTSNIEGLEITTKTDSKDSQLVLPLDEPLTMQPTAAGLILHALFLDGLIFLPFYAVTFVAFFGWPTLRRPGWLRTDAWRFLAARWFADGWAGVAFILPVVCLAGYFAVTQQQSYYLAVVLKADRPVTAHFYFDAGQGYQEADSTRVPVAPGDELGVVRVPVPVNTIRALRFDPAEGPVAMRVASVAVRSDAEDWFGSPPAHSFNLGTLWPLAQMKELVHENDGTVRLLVDDDATAPSTALTLPGPLTLGLNDGYVFCRTGLAAVGWLLLWIAWAEGRRWLPARALAGVKTWLTRAWAARRRLSPVGAVWLVAAGSVVLSSYPVIFCGKSFASVNFEGAYQLYQKFPTLPGNTDDAVEDPRGADVETMVRGAAPAAVAESRALFRHAELPLWNRYDNAGSPLLGQGTAMFADPLHWLVVLAGGRAWAWDAKFLLAKLLFAAGVGLLVLAAARSLPAALLLGFSSAFIGFFAFRLNHPAVFSLCYAPWVLLAWVRVAEASDWRRAAGWLAGLILANWAELNSGSPADACAQALCANLCGALVLLLHRRPAQGRFRRLLGAAAAALWLYLLAAPLLIVFFDALRHAAAPAAAPAIPQLPPGLFAGLFDDIFYRQLTPREQHFDPSANFLVLLGLLLALAYGRRLLVDRTFLALVLGAALPLAVVFRALPLGVVHFLAPAGVVPRPDTAFSGAAFVPLFALAGFGYRECLAQPSRPRWLRHVGVAALGGAALVGAYFLFLGAAHPDALAGLKVGPQETFSPFFRWYVALLAAAAALLPFVLRRLWLRGPETITVCLLAGCLFLLHWRHGIQLHGTFSRYTPVLPARADLLAPSRAVAFLLADHASPFRAVGLGGNLAPGYHAIAGLEGIAGTEALASPYYNDLKGLGLQFSGDWLADASDRARLTAAKPFYDLLNVRYFVTRPGDSLADLPGLRLIGQLDLDVYQNDAAWPRAFFVDRLEQYSGPEDFVRRVGSEDPEPFAAVDASEARSLPAVAGRLSPARAGRTVVPARDYRLTGNWTSFDVAAPRAGVIVLTEGYDKDGVAEVNGRRVPLLRLNHAFKGVLVDGPGLYHVRFGYRPALFPLALGASALGLAALAWAVWLVSRGRWVRAAPRRAEMLARTNGHAIEHASLPGN